MKYVFVILHYLVIEDTIECVNSMIKNLNDPFFEIVIIDNGSGNNSGDVIKETFALVSKVHVIELGDNLGFAQGNNIGYQYAKDNLKADFIIMINNDTIIEQKNFLVEIGKMYQKKPFDILGPDIISLVDLQHQNPYTTNINSFTPENIEKLIIDRKKSLFMNQTYLQKILEYFYNNFVKKIYHRKEKYYLDVNKYKLDYKKELQGYKLHGSCLIFSPDYVKKYKGLFSKTFMYMEEEILFYIAKQENLRMLYSPIIQIFHKEDSSTNALMKSNREKNIFIYKNEIDSLRLLQNIIRDNNLYKVDMISYKIDS